MFEIKTQSRIPIFEQLKGQILEYITAGILQEDEQLPSVRALASQLGINPNTTKHIDVLIREEKLTQFDSCVKELKRCHVDQKELTRRVERIYGEEEPYA